MSSQDLHQPTPVIGGTGETGRRAAQRLGARGLPVRVGSRSAPIPFDWDDPARWVDALRGVRAAYVSYDPDLAIPGAVEAVGALAEAALGSGVSRLVLAHRTASAHLRRGRRGDRPAAGRTIRYEPVSVEAHAAAREAGVPADVVSLLTYLSSEVLDGRNARVADGVERAFGRAPRDFTDDARRTVASGAWAPTPAPA